MKSPQNPSPEQNGGESADLSFEQALAAVEQSLHELQARYAQVQQDQAQQAKLLQQRDQLQQELQSVGRSQLQSDLKQIQQQLDELEINLESRLFQWGSLREVFWQIVRFGGLGVVIGWSLAFVVLQSPKAPPEPGTPAPSQLQP